MERGLMAILIGVGFGLVLGFFTARASARKDVIRSGGLASLLHYIGASGVTGVFPVVLANVILGQGIIKALLCAVVFFAVALISLVGYAALEWPYRQRHADPDRGWTKEDALTSRL